MEKENIKFSYETLWKFIIRPPKDDYTEDLLGQPHFMYRGKTYIRKDYDILSSQGYIMKCSFIEPEDSFRPQPEMPVIIYLHGNSSSRMEGMRTAEEILKRDINLFVLDFPGCGLSEGDYISLGYHESDDLGVVIDFIEKLPGTSKIGLWGRSMGAATTMIYAHRDPRVKAICMDSPFADFARLSKELVLKQVKLPNFVVDAALSIVRRTVKSKNGLDIYKLRPIDQAPKTFQPAIFIHAMKDELINVQHSIELFNVYGGIKSLKCCENGGHNSRRAAKIIKSVGEFFNKYLNSDAIKEEVKKLNEITKYKEFENGEEEEDEEEGEEGEDEEELDNNIENESNNLISKEGIKENSINNRVNDLYEDDKKNKEYLKKKEDKNKKEMEQINNMLKNINQNEINSNFINSSEENNHNGNGGNYDRNNIKKNEPQ